MQSKGILHFPIHTEFVRDVLGVITAELIAGGRGIGTLVSYYSNTFDPNGVFATLIVLVIITSTMTAIMTRIERAIGRWRAPVDI